MKRYIPINNMMDQFKEKKLITWIDKLRFYYIFFIWVGIVAVFGIIYFLTSNGDSYLIYNDGSKVIISNIVDAIYFSFITATSTGFGDIIPFGNFKFIAIIEVLFGLVLLAVVTSKLVSIKQDIILNEIYELSFNEKINRMRSSLLLFRQNLSRIITLIEINKIRVREVNDLYIQISLLEDTLSEVQQIMSQRKNNMFIKGIDPLNAELLFNSTNTSFDKLVELLRVLNQEKKDWKRNITVNMIDRCIKLYNKLYDILDKTSTIDVNAKKELRERKDSIIKSIHDEMGYEMGKIKK